MRPKRREAREIIRPRPRTVSFDGSCLRGKCEQDHELGYELLTRFVAVIVERLQATRLRLLDVYGDLPG